MAHELDALRVHSADHVIHNFQYAYLRVSIVRQQPSFRIGARQPPRDGLKLGEDRTIVTHQCWNFRLWIELYVRRLELSPDLQIDRFKLVRLAGFLKQEMYAQAAGARGGHELH